MSGDLYALIGVIFAAICTLLVGIRGSKGGDRNATASEVEKLGARLDVQAARIEVLEGSNRKYVERVWQLEKVLHEHGIEVPEPLEGHTNEGRTP